MGGVGLIAPRGAPLPGVAGWPIATVTTGWHNAVTGTERQDAARFLAIATHGYARDDGSAAFFPVYPLAVRVVAWLPGVGPLGAALLVSNVSFLVALIMFHGLTRLEFAGSDVDGAQRACSSSPSSRRPSSSSRRTRSRRSCCCPLRRSGSRAGIDGRGRRWSRRSPRLPATWGSSWPRRSRWKRFSNGTPPAVRLLPRLAAAAATALGPLLFFSYLGARFGAFWASIDAQTAMGPELHAAVGNDRRRHAHARSATSPTGWSTC